MKCPFTTEREDYSWGFRNCQTVTSTLTAMGIYTIGIVALDMCLLSLKSRNIWTMHTRKGLTPRDWRNWAGLKGRFNGSARSMCVLCCAVGPYRRVFDFQLSNNESYHTSLFDWVWQYFVQRYKYCGIENGNGQKLAALLMLSYVQEDERIVAKLCLKGTLCNFLEVLGLCRFGNDLHFKSRPYDCWKFFN